MASLKEKNLQSSLNFCLIFKPYNMKKYWYILYTRPGSEKKIAASLTKKKIEYFLPLSYRQKNRFSSRPGKEPLFPGYIFVLVNSSELVETQIAVGSLSVVYWKNNPAVVPFRDIERIKEFTELHEQIKLVPTKVFPEIEPVETPPLIVDETTIATKKRIKKINISSIGFMLMAVEQDKFENTKILIVPDPQKFLN